METRRTQRLYYCLQVKSISIPIELLDKRTESKTKPSFCAIICIQSHVVTERMHFPTNITFAGFQQW